MFMLNATIIVNLVTRLLKTFVRQFYVIQVCLMSTSVLNTI